MKPLQIFLFTLLLSATGWAGLDYSAYLDARTTPVAAQIQGTLGYGQIFYGDSANKNPLYGYIRPSLSLGTSSTITGTVSVDIYPISFFGVTIGHTWNNRRAVLPGLDCGLVDCMDYLNYDFVQSKFSGQVGPWVAQFLYERSFYRENDGDRPYGDGTNIVSLAAQGEVGERWQGIAAYELAEDWNIGILAWDFRTRITNEASDSQVLILRKSFAPWTATVGLGRFGSSQYGVEPTGVLSVTWTGQEKLGY